MLTAVVKGRRRTDQKMGALADAQKQTDEKVGLLADAQRDLAEAQRQTDEKGGRLADAQARTEWAVKDLAKEVGGPRRPARRGSPG
jgi:hypothetical protein